jgi:hypothetical protein
MANIDETATIDTEEEPEEVTQEEPEEATQEQVLTKPALAKLNETANARGWEITTRRTNGPGGGRYDIARSIDHKPFYEGITLDHVHSVIAIPTYGAPGPLA